MYARYRTRSRFYKRPEKVLKAYGVSPNLLRRPKVKAGLLHGIYKDETVDLRDKERLELVEAIRHPKERDFYQDHTYHNQWEMRDLEKHHKVQLAARYKFFSPDFPSSAVAGKTAFGQPREESPWLFYPGDMVEVTKGEGQGQRGAIIAVVKYKNEVLVQNVNVQDVVIPASETRPEQTVQREHPISADRVAHVDPSTNELCQLDLVTVRNKATGALEKKRISLTSGVLLPLPERDDGSVDAGDPLKDTPITDADEATYDPAKEIPLLRDKKLQEMENYFVNHSLKRSYEFHAALSEKNAEQMQAFQMAVVEGAAEKLARRVAQRLSAVPEATILSETHDSARGTQPPTGRSEGASHGDGLGAAMPAWWGEMVAAHMEVLKEEDAVREAEVAELARQAQADRQASNRMVGDVDDDAAFDDDELDEELDDEGEGPARGRRGGAAEV